MQSKLIIDLRDIKINNEDELAEFVSHESQVKDPLNLPQWRFFIKENYQEDKSLLILKMHHVMTDGYGIAFFMANVMDSGSQDLLP